MPTISFFYGLVIYMYFLDNKRHHTPHIHVKYQDAEAVFVIPTGELLEGSIPPAKVKLVQAWIELRQEDLMADWLLAIEGQELFKIDPLR